MNLFLKRQYENVFTTFLNYLGVKYTESFSNKFYAEHPHKYNLYGLSSMLSDYKIENAGIQCNDKKNALSEMEYPFIAHVGADFSVVYKIISGDVYYIWRGKI